MWGFGHNYIVVVLTGDVEYVKISTLRVNAISIEWKHGNDTIEIVSFYNVKLGSRVDFYVQVIELSVDGLIIF